MGPLGQEGTGKLVVPSESGESGSLGVSSGLARWAQSHIGMSPQDHTMFMSYLSSSLNSLRPDWDWLPVAQCHVCCSERGRGCALGPVTHLPSVGSPHPQTCASVEPTEHFWETGWFLRYNWFPGGAVVESACTTGDAGLIPGSGRSKLDPLEKEMTTSSRIPAWEIPSTEEPSGLQSMRLQRVRHDVATEHTRWLNVHIVGGVL